MYNKYSRWWKFTINNGPHLGSSLKGACVSSCRFQKVLIHVKQSLDEGVMPVLPNPSLRRIASDYGLQIWKMIYPFWSFWQALCNVILWFFIWYTCRLLFCRSWIGVRLGHVLESLILLSSYLVPANHNFTKTHGNMLVWTLIRWSNYILVIFHV
jgi:hypothetical protein